MAWQALSKMGAKAESALVNLSQDKNPRIQVRALWLLSKLPTNGQKYVKQALASSNEEHPRSRNPNGT